MSQILFKMMNSNKLLYSLGNAPMGFLFSSNWQTPLLKLLKAQSLCLAFIAVLLSSTNAFAFNKKGEIVAPINSINNSPLANSAPVAGDDVKETNEDNLLFATVASNDMDIDGDVLAYTSLTSVPSTQGTLTFNSNGTFMFVPAANYNGVVTINYKVCDPGNLCDTAILTITVKPVNDAPKVAITFVTTNENVIRTGDLKLRVIDIDNATSTLIFTQIGVMSVTEGTFTLSANGNYVYTPAFNFIGTTASTYKVCDPSNLCDTSAIVISVIAVNDPPIAQDDFITTLEDTLVSSTVATNDSDPDNTTAQLTYAPITSVPTTTGTFVLNPNGSYIFTPADDYFGTVVIAYKVCDLGGLCDTANLTITITPVNDPPEPTDIVEYIDEDTSISGDLKPDVYDPDNLPSSFVFTQIGVLINPNGTFTLNPNGTYSFTPKPNFNGAIQYSYQVCDPLGLCEIGYVTFEVLPVNDKPVVTPLSMTTAEDMPVTGCTTITDIDDGETFTATPCGVNHGTANAVITDNQLCVTYSPSSNYNEKDTICFIICDTGGACDTLKIPIIVTPVNDKPTVTPISISTQEDTPATVCTTINDPDSGDTFTARQCGVKNGTISTAVTGNQLCVTYTPNTNSNGLDTICLIVCDAAGACDTVKIPVSVSPRNDKPTVTPTSITTAEDTPATICTTINDPDAGETFTSSACGVNHGTATRTITGNQLCVTYTPTADYNGRDTACFVVCDVAGACDTIRIPITITPVNDKPTVALTTIATTEDTPATVCTTINDVDLGDTFTATACGVKNGTANAVITGNQICVTYSPSSNYNGKDTICFLVCDAAGACDTLKIPVTVSPVNDKPVVTPTTITTPENTPVTVCTTINDPDVAQTFTVSACGVKHGTAVPTITGNQLCVTYIPTTFYNGLDTACFVVCDAAGACDTIRIPITVTDTNDKPTVTPTTIATPEDTPATVCTTINDPDVGDIFTATSCGVNRGTATAIVTGNQLCVTYTPNANYNGRDTVCFIVCDVAGACDTTKIPVVVSPRNDRPIVVKIAMETVENAPVTTCTTINDPDLGDTHTVSSCGVKHGTATATITGSQLCVTYKPTANYFGLDTACFVVCDAAGACDTIRIPITVQEINDKPIVLPTNIATPEDTSATVCTTINDADLGEIFTATLCGVKNGTATTTITGDQLCVTYSPSSNYNGMDTVCVIVCDKGGACDTIKIPVVVSPLNDKPTVTPTLIATVEDTPATVCTTINDVDLSETFTATLCGVKNGSASANITGNRLCVTYSPSSNYNGLDTICYVICDAAGTCDTMKIPVSVLPLNDRPSVNPLSISTLEDTPASVCTTINDVDLDETFTVSPCGVKNGAASATILGNQLCVTYTPNANYNGRDTACFVICDAAGACDTLKISIVVSPVNDRPSITPTLIATVEDTPATVCTTINDVDLGETFTATLCGVKNGATSAVITSNQLCVTYSPSSNYNGLDTVCYVVCDAAGVCDTVRIPVTVLPVNDRPVVTPLSIFTVEDSTAAVCTTINDPDLGETFTATLCGVKDGKATTTILGNQLCVIYTPNANYNGLDTACVIVCDANGSCDTVKIPIIIKSVNDTPSVNITPITVLKDSVRQVCFDLIDSDVNDMHIVTVCGVQTGSATVSVSNRKVCVTYTSKISYIGQDTVCITVCDSSGLCITQLIPIDVIDCVDKLAPIMVCPAKVEVSITSAILSDPNKFITKVGFSDNCEGLKLEFNKLTATDDCGTPIVTQIAGLPSGSDFRVGLHYISYQALDNSGKITTCQVEMAVSPINLLEVSKISVCPNENLSLKAKTYAGANYKWTGPRNVNVDSVLLTVPRTAGESVEVYSLAATFGACTFTDSVIVTFRVRPVLNNDFYKVAMNTDFTGNILSNDSTITPQKYTVKLAKTTGEGNLTFKTDGSFVYRPSNNYTGADNFTYEVCPVDCPNSCEKATATLSVANEKFANRGTNVITPNGDGLNDALEIEGFNPDAPNNQSDIVIYNQWGNLVYTTKSYRNDWQGTFKDNPLPTGTYYFIFRKSPDAKPLKDFVTIIR